MKVRQPLSRVLVQAPSLDARAHILVWLDTILDELNVKSLEFLDNAGDLVTYKLRANLPKLGPKIGKQIGALRQVLETPHPKKPNVLAMQRGAVKVLTSK